MIWSSYDGYEMISKRLGSGTVGYAFKIDEKIHRYQV